MDIQTYPRGTGTLVMMLSGRFDHRGADEFIKLFDSKVGKDHSKIIIDCGKLEAISSLGLGTLLRVESRLKARGGRACLANVPGPVAEVLHLVRLDKMLGIYDSIDAAEKALEAEG